MRDHIFKCKVKNNWHSIDFWLPHIWAHAHTRTHRQTYVWIWFMKLLLLIIWGYMPKVFLSSHVSLYLLWPKQRPCLHLSHWSIFLTWLLKRGNLVRGLISACQWHPSSQRSPFCSQCQGVKSVRQVIAQVKHPTHFLRSHIVVLWLHAVQCLIRTMKERNPFQSPCVSLTFPIIMRYWWCWWERNP